jgi:hypothetical protein
MEGDLLLAGVASALMKSASNKATPGNSVGIPTSSGLTESQLGVISNAIQQGVSSIQIPAPQITLPPAQVQFPDNLKLSFSDAELARIAQSLAPGQSAGDLKSRIYQRTIIIDIGTSTIPTSTFVYAEFPVGQKVASFNFAQQAGLIGVTLSASIVNTQTKPCGFFVALADTPLLNFDTTPYTSTAEVGNPKTPDSQILLSVFTHQNSTATTVNPNTRAASLSFGLDNAVQIVNSQSTLSLYAFQTADVAGVSGVAGQLMSAVLTAYYIPTEDS